MVKFIKKIHKVLNKVINLRIFKLIKFQNY